MEILDLVSASVTFLSRWQRGAAGGIFYPTVRACTQNNYHRSKLSNVNAKFFAPLSRSSKPPRFFFPCSLGKQTETFDHYCTTSAIVATYSLLFYKARQKVWQSEVGHHVSRGIEPLPGSTVDCLFWVLPCYFFFKSVPLGDHCLPVNTCCKWYTLITSSLLYPYQTNLCLFRC